MTETKANATGKDCAGGPVTAGNVVVCSIKGGVGKSTLCSELRYSLERSGIACKYYDMDGTNDHDILFGKHIERMVPPLRARVFDLSLKSSPDMVPLLGCADVVVLPVRPSPIEIPAFREALEVVRASCSCRVVIVVNCVNSNSVSNQFVDWVTGVSSTREPVASPSDVFKVPMSEAMPQADMEQVSVVEYAPDSGIAHAMQAFVDAVRVEIGLGKEM